LFTGLTHVTSDAQVSSNVPASRRRPRRRPRNRAESPLRELTLAQIITRALKISPLAKGVNGYVEIEAAWDRLLRPPTLPTEDFDALFFPPDQASVPLEPLDKGGRICKVKARVTKTGPAEWVPNPSDNPCDHSLESVDSYRRHIIIQHLSCARAPGKQEDWISEL
jgi:hypothetical protein